ncbi:hypothetical protein A9Q81_12920 [Gammaproteobacteria bacterium 42_54_T18]|nr:hypothetical protein A9Q81_12920 [Gammaproteobacteria bacterium 42_54_T18]
MAILLEPGFKVDVSADAQGPSIRTINQRLNDFSHFPHGGQNEAMVQNVLDQMGPGFVSIVKVPAMTSVYQCATGTYSEYHRSLLQNRIDDIHSLGGEPILDFSGTPECMVRQPSGILEAIFGDTPDQRPPENAEEYGNAIEYIIRLVTEDRIHQGKRPVKYFYPWVEPDFYIWYKGFWPEFINKQFIPFGLALQRVENDTGLDLTLFTAATSSMVPSFFKGPGNIDYELIESMVTAAEVNDFDLEGILWNYYASYPFIGKGRSEFEFGDPIDSMVNFFLKRTNSKTSAALYFEQISTLKTLYPDKKLGLAEWSILVGGEDERTHNHEGGSLIASGLSAMQEAGLDFANVFTLYFKHEPTNRLHALLNLQGIGDQRWNALDFWSQLGEEQLKIRAGGHAPDHDVWSTVTRHTNGDISIMIANHRGKPRHERYDLAIRLENFNQFGSTVYSQWIEPGQAPYGPPEVKWLNAKNNSGGGLPLMLL